MVMARSLPTRQVTFSNGCGLIVARQGELVCSVAQLEYANAGELPGAVPS